MTNKNMNCEDDAFACKSCEEIWCVPCVENDPENDPIGRDCACGDWYCIVCADDIIQSNQCCGCGEVEIYCEECSYNKKMEKARENVGSLYATIASLT